MAPNSEQVCPVVVDGRRLSPSRWIFPRLRLKPPPVRAFLCELIQVLSFILRSNRIIANKYCVRTLESYSELIPVNLI